MTDPDELWRRTIEPSRALDPTYAKPPPWFAGGHPKAMIGVVTVIAILIVLRIITTGYLIEEWYVWWRAAVPTVLPKSLPVARTPASPIGNAAAWFGTDDFPPPRAVRARRVAWRSRC